jgi:TM2 domain-containing membrane protein YozV
MVFTGLHTFYILGMPITNAITRNKHWTVVPEIKPIQSSLTWQLTISAKNAKIGRLGFTVYKYSTLWLFDKNHEH